MLDAIKKIFRRKHTTPSPAGNGVGERLPLRIEGVKPAPLTAEPDDAELAAQALLDTLASEEFFAEQSGKAERRVKSEEFATAQHDSTAQPHQPIPADAPTRSLSTISHHTSEYYHALADRIRTARTAEARLTMRLLASVEEQLAEPTALYRGQWGDTERKLYRAMDIAEREGGELHRRWQHCLANVLVRQMEEERENEERRMKNEELSESPADPNTTTN